MKMKRKLTSTLFTILSLFGISSALASCGGNRNDNTITISRWASEWEKKILTSWTDEFVKENPQYKVKWEFSSYSSHFDKLRTDLLGELASDVIFVNNWGWGPYQNINRFENLGDAEELKDVYDTLLPSAKDNAYVQKGKIISMPIGLVTRVPVVNKADWKNVEGGIPYNREHAFTGKELVDLLDDVCTLTNKEMGINVTLNDALDYFLCSVDAPTFNEDGSFGLNNEAGYKAAQEFKEFVQSGVVVPYSQANGGTYGTVSDTLFYGNTIAGWANIGHMSNYTSNGLEVATIAPMKATDGHDVAVGDFNALVVPTFSKNKKGAFALIKWMMSKEQQLKYASFSDLPVVQSAYDEVMTDTKNWNPEIVNSYKIGVDNIYVRRSTTAEFQTYYDSCLKSLCNSPTYSGEDFCKAIATNGGKYL